MRRQLLLLSVVLLFALALSFTSPVGIQRVGAAGAARETQPVYTTPDGFLLGPAVPAAYATLVRNKNGLTTNVHTSVISGPGAYTVWWVIFNDPASCAFYLCTFDEPDLVVNATGKIVPAGGAANFGAWVGPGGPYSGEIIFGDPQPGLTNPSGALIVLVVRYHGPAIPGQIPEQLTTFFGGGCGFDAMGNPTGPCVDEQLVVFPGDCSGDCLDPSKL
jgi:hypothetical protein